MTQHDDTHAISPADAAMRHVEAAAELRARALEEARASVQEHLRRAEELRQSAVAAARELLGKAPGAASLLASVEQSIERASIAGLDAMTVGLAQALCDPLSVTDGLLARRRVSLDTAIERFAGGVRAEPEDKDHKAGDA